MNQKELKELIEFLIEKDIAEFELERGDVKVRIKRGAEQTAHAAGEARFFAVPAATTIPVEGAAQAAPAAAAPAAPAPPAEEQGLQTVKSPIVGTFYEA